MNDKENTEELKKEAKNGENTENAQDSEKDNDLNNDLNKDPENTEKESADSSENSEENTENKEEDKKDKAKESKSFFSKKNKKDPKDEKIEELTDRVARQMAEFDNFRKRTEKEKAMMFDLGAKAIIEKILPVIDNFERGFKGLTEEEMQQPFVAGMDKIYKQMMTGLTDAGLKEIDALNQEFNPDFHNAVMHVDDENEKENTVVEVFQKGYFYKDTVVRHSMVKVAN